MVNEEQFVALMKHLSERQKEAIEAIAEDENQSSDEVYEKLMDSIKRQTEKSLTNLMTLYKEYINQEDCTISTFLEYVPWIAINGAWLASLVGVTLDEYYVIVDYFLNEYNLQKEQKE